MFWNKPKKSYEADLSPKIRLQNARFLYKQMGSHEFVKSLPKHKRAKMRRYNMEVAKAYDRDLYEGNDVNRGLQEINKKYGFPTFSQSFLSDIAEFAKLSDYIKSELTNPTTISQANDPNYSPSALAGRAKRTIKYAGLKGGFKYAENRANRRQRKQLDKWKAIALPPSQTPEPKPNGFLNFFRKKQPTTSQPKI